MSRAEIRKLFKENRERWQKQLRKKLEREAFNEKYECYTCGAKEKLEIHHLLYTGNKEDFFDKKYWLILCIDHHKKAEGQKMKKKREVENDQGD